MINNALFWLILLKVYPILWLDIDCGRSIMDLNFLLIHCLLNNNIQNLYSALNNL